MRNLTRFWRSLETLAGCATVTAEWKHMTGDQYESARRFLRSSGELAGFYPHPDPGVCFYRVVSHAPDDHVGICDETGERVALETRDLILCELDRLALQRAIAEAFGFLPADPRDGQGKPPWRIGRFEPVAGYGFSVFLTITSARADALQAVCRLVATQQAPFVLFAPTGRLMTEESQQLLRRQDACFLPLVQTTCLDGEDRLVPSPAGRSAVEEFRSRVVPRAERQSERVFFPTPAAASWSDVRLRLVDGHTVSASVGGARGVYNFAEMGMANQKNGTPTVQWELLREFAAGHGVLTWQSRGADRKNKKRRENLARDLQEFFRIDGDPFVRHGNGWRARFQIESDH